MKTGIKLGLILWLKRMKITQGELVRGAGLASETRLSRIINGLEEPKQEEMERICLFLDVPAHKVFESEYDGRTGDAK